MKGQQQTVRTAVLEETCVSLGVSVISDNDVTLRVSDYQLGVDL